jgi:hypothetical protein
MANVTTEELILEMQNRLVEPGLTEAQIDKYERIIKILKEQD